MGSTMKPTIFDDRVATALKSWHHTAKKNAKESKHSSNSPFSSRPATPDHGSSPMHLLHAYQQRSNIDSLQASPTAFNNLDPWANVGSSHSPHRHHLDEDEDDDESIREHGAELMADPANPRDVAPEGYTQREIDIVRPSDLTSDRQHG